MRAYGSTGTGPLGCLVTFGSGLIGCAAMLAGIILIGAALWLLATTFT